MGDVVRDRAAGFCEYCLCEEAYCPAGFSREHILPKSAGGSDDDRNCALACQGWNNHKFTAVHATDPVTGNEAPLYHPRNDSWQQHFVWDSTQTEIIGVSATGRATIQRLRLNRPHVVNHRRVLRISLKRQPPDWTLPGQVE